MIADTTREVITVTSNTGKYPPTYGDLFLYVIERGGTSPDGVEMESSGPWPVTNIHTPSGDEASVLLRPVCPSDARELAYSRCFVHFSLNSEWRHQ